MRAKWVAMMIVLAACGGNGATTTTEPGGTTTSAATQTTTTAAATTTTTLVEGPVDILALTPIPFEMADFDNEPAPDLGVTMFLVTGSPLKAVFHAMDALPNDCLGFTLWYANYTNQYLNGHIPLTPDGCEGATPVFGDDQILYRDPNTIIVDFGDLPEGTFAPAFQLLAAGLETGYYTRSQVRIEPAAVPMLTASGLVTLLGGSTLSGANDEWRLFALPEATPGTCQPSDPAVCLNNDRFRVEASFGHGGGMTEGAQYATPLPPQGDTGKFWFFRPENVDLVVKVLNGCSVNDRYWVFVGGTQAGRVQIEDTVTGETNTYEPQFGLEGIADTEAFATCP